MTLGKLRHSLALLGSIAALVFPGMVASAQTVAEALELVPADAELVMVIPNPRQLSEKTAAFCQKLGVQDAKMNDLLGSVKEKSQLFFGVNENAPMVMAFKNLTAGASSAAPAGQTPEKPIWVLFLNIADMPKFLTNFETTQDINGFLHVTFRDPNRKPGVIRFVDSYAVITADEQTFLSYEPARQSARMLAGLGELGQSSLAQGDLTAWVNLQPLGPKLLPLIDQAEANMQNSLAASPTAANPSQMAMAKLFFSLYARAGRTLVRDAITAGISLDLNPQQGIGMTFSANLKPDSQSAKLLGTGKANSALLDRLPAQPYIGALATDFTGMDMTYLVNEIKAALPTDSTDLMVSAIRLQLDLLTQHQTMAVAYYPASPKPGSMSLFSAVGLLQVSDAAKVRQGLAQYYQSIGEVPGPTPGTKMYQASYQPNATTVQGLSVDQYSMQINMTPEMMGNPAMQFMNMLGVANQTGLVTSKGQQMIVTYGTDVNLLQSALTAMDRTDGLGQNAAMVQVRKQLPANLVAEGYFSITGTLSGVAPMLMMFGVMPPATAGELPPVALGVGAKQGSVAARYYVPMENITYVKNMIDQVEARQQMQQAPGTSGTPGSSGSAPRRRPNQTPPAQPAQ